jgi:phosphatidylserine/phosphatidylglycerophosphate/cardiolipin synthase-like enzyme
MGRELVILSPAERRDTLLHVIRHARRRLTFSLFRCDDRKVLDELAEARDRGVRVEALVTPSAKGWEKRLKDLRGLLTDLGAEVHRYDGGSAKYHAKYMVADDSTAVVASLNFTQKCFRETCDFLLVSHDPNLISSLRRLFKADCRAAGSPFPRNLSERLIVGPEQARRRIEALIRGAKRRIRIMDHRIADPDMLELLKDRRTAGVNVEVLDDREIGGLRAHGKMMLVDDNVAVLGSLSLSPPSLDNRREVAVIVRQPEVVDRLSKFFDERKAQRE